MNIISLEQGKTMAERLLEEARLRLDREFENNGGRNFWEWVWRWLGYYY